MLIGLTFYYMTFVKIPKVQLTFISYFCCLFEATDLLKQRYGNTQILIGVHMKKTSFITYDSPCKTVYQV